MKVLAYDEAFASRLHQLPTLTDPSDSKIAIVIGIPGPKQAILTHIALTPPLEKTTDKIEPWVGQHAKQVSRMLPGGVDILGIAALAAPDVFEKQKAVLKQVLSSVHKILCKTEQLQDYPVRTMLHIDPSTFKMTSRLIDTTTFSGNGLPQDVKQIKNCTNFSFLKSQLPLEFLGHISNEVLDQSLINQLMASMSFIETAIREGDVLIENQRVQSDAPLSSLSESNELTTQFAVRQTRPERSSTISLTTIGAEISVRGAVQLRAVLPPRATCAEAILAIKQDAIRNLHSRCGMHSEDLLLIEDEQRDPSMTHELPRRVFVKKEISPSGVPFCDFVFHGDDPNDCLQAFQEILGLDVKVEEFEDECEKSPPGECRDARDAAQVEELVEEIISEGAKQLQKDPSNIIKLALSCCVVILAILIAYILIRP